jgi:predicted translin family RNA/ssDNA-binding protein
MARSLEDIASYLKDMEQLLEALCQLEAEKALMSHLQLKTSLIQIISDLS